MAARDLVGPMRHLVEVQRDEAASKRASGELVEDWQAVFQEWASIEPLAGREFWNAVQVQANVTHKIRIRVRDDVTFTADMRVVLLPNRTRVFCLSGPPRNLNETYDFWEMLAVETVANPRA